MKKYILICSVILTASFSLQNCAECDDCFGVAAPKELKYMSSQGYNLIFDGIHHYDLDDISIKNNFGDFVEFTANTKNKTIDFGFTVGIDTYYIKLSPSVTDTLVFTYTKDKHIDCCNEYDVTETTEFNGKQISNDDRIVIIRN